MGWAKYEEDNREARTERYSSGNYFWTPYTSQETYKVNSYKPVPLSTAGRAYIQEKEKLCIWLLRRKSNETHAI